MTPRAKRVVVYTATLLISPLPAMPFVRGTREFILSLIVCGALLSTGSLYTLAGERRGRTQLGMKLIAASAITSIFGLALLVGAIAVLLVDPI